MKRGRPPSRRPMSWSEATTSYQAYLQVHRGLSGTHCFHVLWVVSHFVAFALEQQVETPCACSLQTVDLWVKRVAERNLAQHTLNSRLSAVRLFLRFLYAEEYMADDLSLYVEGPRLFREATVPEHLPWHLAVQLHNSVDAGRPYGLRDRATILLLMTLGLRASEIPALMLEDIDWQHASMLVRRRKNRRPLHLPLLPVVVEALTLYLQERPSTTPYRELFLSRYGKPFTTGSPISCLVRRLLVTAGFGIRCAAHALRRGLGTYLLEQGVGLAEIALILGHESLSSTRQYIRLSMAQLREVADNYAELL